MQLHVQAHARPPGAGSLTAEPTSPEVQGTDWEGVESDSEGGGVCSSASESEYIHDDGVRTSDNAWLGSTCFCM